ncbi:MAG: hypothetical protein UX77_C0004G0009 [Parcubacteria group bacterium GW2011_GWA1_47_11]|uniref:Uncharacterized protein n=1 Tax=Candidatus Nomurabacteria bacterium GW2011_GWB1_47_6 TaxID=1618749 RepID=A0A0G1VCQ3_9BACT|nr:MAG: hypothetical protein UX77_C0004G0009 [Parcubacteria group bacterium GW2011_GWA1_47_11]KKU75933.1 MAG: hypothetical protein UY01_C0001G0029 [Candidatus Nomurabacteria bacterium GW2011_GWB1_47_6]
MEPEKKMNGAMVGLIIIIVILVLGGIYIWQSKVKALPEGTLQGEVVSPEDEEELNSLEQDLDSVNTDIEANVIESVE